MQRKESALALLRVIAGQDRDGYIEIRSPGTLQRFVSLPRFRQAANVALAKCLDADVYVGCAPRVEEYGGARAIRRAWALWADLDGQEGIDLLATFPHPPTLTVASGSPHSLHAWWALDAPLRNRWVRQALGRLTLALSVPCPNDHAEPACNLCHLHRIGADPAATDVARVLRIPGTLNHKTAPPNLVKLASYHPERVYSIAALVGNLPDLEPPRPPTKPRARPVAGDEPLRDVESDVYYERLTGMEGRIGRHVTCPFHDDEWPSMMLYPNHDFYCFQCRKGGDIYNFGAALWGMDSHGVGFLDLKDRLREALNGAQPTG